MTTATSSLDQDVINGLPNISGHEDTVQQTMQAEGPFYLNRSDLDFGKVKSCTAMALHMHQPLIPAGGDDLHTATVISNLKDMFSNPSIGDNHNAGVFHWCYKRLGEFIPQLVGEGKKPRIMLDYSGTLLYGVRQMGLNDVIDNLRTITCDDRYARCTEWLATGWGHPVAPSTPVPDFYLHARAWQHHFASLFGTDALKRVRGFSPSEMALPNHPDVAYEYIKVLKDCGFRYVLVQEHTIEDPETGHGAKDPHVPHRLVCRSSGGDEVAITCLIKTQGSDTKLVAQMQPLYEARGLNRRDFVGHNIPPIVSQIADGENGGVMMNEFPEKYKQGIRESSDTETPVVNGCEYLEYLDSLGISEKDYPEVQPIMQKQIWDRMDPGDGKDKLDKVIEACKQADGRFNVEGGSWTNDISWVQGYDHVLGPMEKVSSKFNEKVRKSNVSTDEHRYRNALFYLLVSQTSCYRYWGEGRWTDYGKELCRRAEAIMDHDF